ncbi:phosphoesterase family-domain-containing protein [Syncephalis fuscata]|nr:phosphoesterase family-domain-containing protein [Syncephalis fuscata]
MSKASTSVLLKIGLAALCCHVTVVSGAVLADRNINLDSLNKLIRDRIEHVVVMVLENRSFDHVLGTLGSVNSNIDGLSGHERNYWNVTDKAKGYQGVITNTTYWQAPLDPEHILPGVTEQIFGSKKEPNPYPKVAPMDGFAQNAMSFVTKGDHIAERRQHAMSAWPVGSLPITHALAQEFAVFDRWFSSVPGPTMPNRQFIYSATSNGYTTNNVGNTALGYPQRTVYSSLNDKSVNWHIYFHDVPTALAMRELRSPKNLLKLRLINRFYQHAREGRLPALSMIEPRYLDTKLFPANDNHPPHDSRYSEKLIKDVYEALRASPTWNKTLLIFTYDEHGGYYDHVPTPLANVPSPDGKTGVKGESGEGFRFDRLGIRVPTILISPWIRRGSVYHEPQGPQPTSQFEHHEWAGAIEPVLAELTKMRTDCPMKLPDISLPSLWQPFSPLGGQGEEDEADIPFTKNIPDDESKETGYFTDEAHAVNNNIDSLIKQVKQRDISSEAGL